MSSTNESSEDEVMQEARPQMFRQSAVITDPTQFRECFRLTPRLVDVLLNILGEQLQPSSFRSNPLSAEEKLLCALRFYASNFFYYSVGDAQGPSKQSVHRAIRQVTSAINAKLSDRIKWPSGEGECRRIASQFFVLRILVYKAVFVFSNVLPLCFRDAYCVWSCRWNVGHRIIVLQLSYCPSEHESQFIDRHQQHSINAMAVAGPDYQFFFLSAKWPGSVNARVLRNSSMATRFNGGWRPFPGAVILGDSIYGASDWLVPMRPHAEQRFNNFYKCHAKTRRVVECAFGLFKNRFQCLKSGLRLKNPTYCGEVIMACGRLHNFLIEERMEEEDDDCVFMERLQNQYEEEPEQDTFIGQQRFISMFNSFCAVNNLL